MEFKIGDKVRIALRRLINKMNEPVKPEPKFNVGDIVEVLENVFAPDETKGLQGVIIDKYSEGINTNDFGYKVKFTVAFRGRCDWNYTESNLKLIHKA